MAKNHNKYRKDKPWDSDDINHWKIEEWKPDFLPGNLMEESSFATLFPKYREKYLRDVWPIVTKSLEVFNKFVVTYYAYSVKLFVIETWNCMRT